MEENKNYQVAYITLLEEKEDKPTQVSSSNSCSMTDQQVEKLADLIFDKLQKSLPPPPRPEEPKIPHQSKFEFEKSFIPQPEITNSRYVQKEITQTLPNGQKIKIKYFDKKDDFNYVEEKIIIPKTQQAEASPIIQNKKPKNHLKIASIIIFTILLLACAIMTTAFIFHENATFAKTLLWILFGVLWLTIIAILIFFIVSESKKSKQNSSVEKQE